MNDKMVFVAGATGLAGTAVIQGLLRRFPDIRIRASLHSNSHPNVPDARIEYVPCDLRNELDCQTALAGCDAAIMTAASGGGAAMLNSEPWRQLNSNVLLGIQFLQACGVCGVRRVIMANSATLYQSFEGHIREEQLDLNKDPFASYFGIGWATRFVEKVAEFWHRERGMQVVIARTSNIFGPYARFDPAVSNFIPALIRKAVDRLDPFEVWGSPDVIRDVLYAEDFADAIIAMLLREDIPFDVFNLASGTKTTVGDVVTWALHYAKHSPGQVVYRQDRPTTISFRALDISKIKERIAWQPATSPEQGIRKTVEWWTENRHSWKR